MTSGYRFSTYSGAPLMGDSFTNMLAGLGVTGRDKLTAQVPTLRPLGAHELVDLYRGDWLSRKIVDIPAFDSTRAWRHWNADKDDTQKIEKIEKDFGLQRKAMEAFVKARLYGGAAIVLGVKGAGEWNEPLDLDKVTKGALKFIHVVTGGKMPMLAAGPLTRDITSPWFGEPNYYQRSNVPIMPAPGHVTPPPNLKLGKGPEAFSFFIHPSRIVRLTGLDYPDMETAPDAWGDSVLQPVWDAIRDAGLVGQSIANLTSRANVNVITMPGLTQKLATTEGTAEVTTRFANANVVASVVNALLLDKDEEWNQLSVNFSQLPQIVQMYLLIGAAAADIPATRLLAREPAGQNATGDSDTRNYYDRLSSDQKVRITPLLSRLDEVLIRSALGKRPTEIDYTWNPLWQLDDAQKADVNLKNAQAFQIDNNSGLIDPIALKKGRENQLIANDVYPGLDQAINDAEQGNEADGEDIDEAALARLGLDPDTHAPLQLPPPGGMNGGGDDGRPGGAGPNGKNGSNGNAQVRDARGASHVVPFVGKKPLYVHRPLLDCASFLRWAKAQGFTSVLGDPHVTLLYSKAPMDWRAVARDTDAIMLQDSGPRTIEQLGDAIVLRFNSHDLSNRHNQFVAAGGSHDYPSYQPHVTITYQKPDGLDLGKVAPYRGSLIFGPEQYRDLQSVSDAEFDPEKHPHGEHGEFEATGAAQPAPAKHVQTPEEHRAALEAALHSGELSKRLEALAERHAVQAAQSVLTAGSVSPNVTEKAVGWHFHPKAKTAAWVHQAREFIHQPGSKRVMARATWEFTTKTAVGVTHHVLLHKLLLPVVEGAVIGALAELGAPLIASSIAVSIAGYAVSKIVEHSPLSAERAHHLLIKCCDALIDEWGKVPEGTDKPLAGDLPTGGWVAADAADYADMLRALERLRGGLEALDDDDEPDLGEALSDTWSEEAREAAAAAKHGKTKQASDLANRFTSARLHSQGSQSRHFGNAAQSYAAAASAFREAEQADREGRHGDAQQLRYAAERNMGAANDYVARHGLRTDADWNEGSHPREAAGSPTGGQFASAGAATETFVSPNTAALSFAGAQAAMNSDREHELAAASADIDRALGLTSHNVATIGAWTDGAENALMSVTEPGADPQLVRAAAAMKGALADQKAVLVFRPNPTGQSFMANFVAKGDLSDIHKALLTDGLPSHTLQPMQNGAVVHIIGTGQRTLNAVGKAASRYGTQASFVPGDGEFIGTTLTTGTDRDQRDDALAQYQRVIAQATGQREAGRDVASVWHDIRARWGTLSAGTGSDRRAVGSRSLQQAQADAARAARGYPALAGLPQTPIELQPGRWYVPGPIGRLKEAAEDYAKSAGISYTPPTTYAKLNKDRAGKIAAAFDAMPHAPDDPHVKAAYEAMARETIAQWDALKKTGLRVQWIKPGQADPYASNPRLAAMDVADNNHWWGFPTDQGFGSGPEAEAAMKDNPLLAETGEVIDGRHVVVNDVFRIVHDLFGHLKEGNGFRGEGEENAWRVHSAMYSPLAREAMTTETRGQNSWVNYGPHGQTNRTASAADTHYAPQKIGVLPSWVVNDGSGRPGTLDADFDETKHPRVESGPGGGQFASAGGAAPVKPKLSKSKLKGDLKKFAGPRSDDGALDTLAEHLADKDISAEEFEQGMFAGLATGKPNFVGQTSAPGYIDMSATIPGGSLARSIDFNNKTAGHNYFAMGASYTGAGTAKKLLASQVALYQKLGLDKVTLTANIDVGGYAWAKYGFVPTRSAWYDLQSELEKKISGGSSGYEADSWDTMSSDAQDEAERQYVREAMDEEIRYQTDNWRENGDADDEAKDQIIQRYDEGLGAGADWVNDTLDEVREDRETAGQSDIPYTNDQLWKAMTLSTEHGWEGKKDDVDFNDKYLKEPNNLPPPEQMTLPGVEPAEPSKQLTDEMRDQISTAVLDAFKDKAHDIAEDMDPPSWIHDAARESVEDYWSSMSDRDRFRWVTNNTNLAEEHDIGEPELDITDPTARGALEKAINSDDPKAIWTIADSKYGKDLLLGTDWSGRLDLHDPEAMTRFNSYVAKAKPAAVAKAA